MSLVTKKMIPRLLMLLWTMCSGQRALKTSLVSKAIPLSIEMLTTSSERMSKAWKSPAYAFFEPIPDIEYKNGRRSHVFKCASKSCKFTCRRFLDTGDKTSTGNLLKHIRKCWGAEALKAALACKDCSEAAKVVVKRLKPVAMSGSIATSSKREGKGIVTYSHKMHTEAETR
jgi:hypothetical protein